MYVLVSHLHVENMNCKIHLLIFHNPRNLNVPSRCIGHIGSGARETSGGGRPEGVDFWESWIPLYINIMGI